VNGARRWLPLGLVNLQPSELMKLFAVLYAADYTSRKLAAHGHDLPRAFLPLASAMVAVGILLLKEPDFGAFVVIIAIAMGILFLGGMRARLFVVLIFVLVAAFAALIIISPYRRDRIFGFMDPWADAFGRGYQLSHALIAFGRGELLGVGLGASVEKLFYLPEAHTDFLLAVIAEELGFVGVLTVIVLFGLLIQRAFAIGRQAVALDRLYSALVAQGIGVWMGVQGLHQHGRQHRAAADQGPDTAPDEFWRLGNSRQLRGGGRTPENRLGESPVDAGSQGMSQGLRLPTAGAGARRR
jgi:cell division protein FtsW